MAEHMSKNVIFDYVIETDKSGNSLKMPGKGNMDFYAIRDALKQIGYTGPAFVEVYSQMFADLNELYESRAQMQRIFDS